MEDDDAGFVAYVPNTVDPGPSLLIATFLIFVLALVTLPIAVILGDRHEELEKGDNATDEQGDSNKDDEGDEGDEHDDDDDASVSSKGTYYSAISGALKDLLDQPGRPSRPKGIHKRHKRRHRAAHQPIHAIEEVSLEMVDTASTGGSSANKKYDALPAPPSLNGDAQQIGGTLAGSVRDEGFMSTCGVSDYGGEKLVAVTGHDDTMIDRKVCLTLDGFWDEMASIMAFDYEMRRIIKLALPFATQALFTGVLDIMTVGVIGKLVGTNELSAFVIVNMLVELTTQFVGGFHDALTTLCSQAIGAKKYRLAGKYVQIATIFYCICYLPFAIMWVFLLGDAIEWFGFDAEIVRMGEQYGYLLLVDYLMAGVGEAIHALLDVAGFENYSTCIGAVEELLAFLTVLVWALLGAPSVVVSPLFTVGAIQFGVGMIFLVLNLFIIWQRGWFLPYRDGMVGSLALSDKKAVWLVCHTAMSLAFGYLLTDGEWELLTIFAGFLGPAEVAAWGIFGTIWDAVNELIDGIADASEVRCAFLLGSNQPEKARLSAYKSLMICVFTSLFTTSVLFMCGEDLPTWLTNDPTLQHLLNDLLPMFGVGNLVMTLGTMSWTLLGSQGRYRLATVVVCIASWLVTLPLAAIFSVWLKISLEGQTAAVVVGYVVSGSVHAYFLFRSDWVALSYSVMDENDSRASDDDDTPTPAVPATTTTPWAISPAPEIACLPERGALPRRPSGQGVELLFSTGITGEWKDASYKEEMEIEIGDSLP